MTNQAGEKSETSFRKVMNFFSKPRKQVSDSQSSSTSPGLRRSRSLTSAAFLVKDLELENSSSPSNHRMSTSSSKSNALNQQRSRKSQLGLNNSRAPTPERKSKSQQFDATAGLNAHGVERPYSSAAHHDSCGSSSNSSSSNTIDRYIDVEQQPLQESSKLHNSFYQRNCVGNGSGGGRRPPRVQHPVPASPTGSVKDKPRSHSFREAKGTGRLSCSSKDWVDNGIGHESPRRLAKNVIERLSQSHVPKASSWDFNNPITIDDVYARSCFDSNVDVVSRKSYSMDEPYETINGYHVEDFSDFERPNCIVGDDIEGLKSVEIEEQIDMELRRRSKEAEKRVVLLSEELEHGHFLQDGVFDVPALIEMIRNLTEEKMGLALEVSGILQSQMIERTSAKEELRLAKEELESRTNRLEKEKAELQLALEKELDRRSSDWSFKLERYQLEEQRLRDRVRELAEQNVSLQREVSSFSERDTESRSKVQYSEKQLKNLTTRVEEMSTENHALQQSFAELQEKYIATEEERDFMKRNFEEKVKECRELHKSITRLLRTCSEQEKTIDGLREGLNKQISKKQSPETNDKYVSNLQTEQLRLTGVELALRREVESYRVEADSLRRENINLLERLKGNMNDMGALTFKLDKEMWTRICCLESQGLSLLHESSRLSSKLLDFAKGKSGQNSETKHGIEASKNGLDEQFVVESEIKVQGFKRGIESLTRSLQTISTLLQDKSSEVAMKSQSRCTEQLNDRTLEDVIKSELKAESLLTNLLREKLYSKELEVEQLQAELATSVRGNDILRFEVQSAMDNLSSVNHKLKDLELQMLKKDENICQLHINLQECTKELTVMRGLLPKVSQERDMMWEEVKQYSEKNMLLNSEVNALKKKIEALDEDVLLKEGQITILKDSVGNTPSFDLLASPDNMREFRLQK